MEQTPFQQLVAQHILSNTHTPEEHVPQTQFQQLLAQHSEKNILPIQTQITQRAGTRNPELEVFSNGVARDTNFAAPMNTPVNLPPGQWQIEEAYGAAPAVGGPRNATNNGYGNKVTARNMQTGEKFVYEHLGQVQVRPGQIVTGGTVGTTGSSGNATGPNLGVEYMDSQGKLGNIENSPYKQYLPGIQ